MNPIRQFIVRWTDRDGNEGQTMPDTDHTAMSKWAAAMNHMNPGSHTVEEWEQREYQEGK